MARKKVSHSHQDKPLTKQDDSAKTHQEVAPTMDSDSSEKLESLKSLNQMLLKEAFERRQQVEPLVQSKAILETELSRSNSDKDALQSELNRIAERAARLELERSVVGVFVAAQVGFRGEEFERKVKGLEMETAELKRVVGEKESEVERLSGRLSESEVALGDEREVSRRVCVERDEVKEKLGRQIEECKGLTADLVMIEERKRGVEREIGELRDEYDSVCVDMQEVEMRLDSVTREKDSVERSLVESNKLVEEMKEELSGVVREKEKIEEERSVEVIMRQELESALKGINEMVVNLQEERVKLQAYVVELEKKSTEGEEREKDMKREIDQLVEEKRLGEERIEVLACEKVVMGNDLSGAMEQLVEQKKKIEKIVSQKDVIMEAKDRLDGDVTSLHKQVHELTALVSKLEASNQEGVEKIKSLESEIGDYVYKLEQCKSEKDVMKKCLDEEMKDGVLMNEKIKELEKKIEEKVKAFGEVKAENGAIFAKKLELEGQCEIMRKEIASLEKEITEARNESDLMKGKVELEKADSEKVMNMLKEAVAFCSEDESDLGVGISGEDTSKAYEMQLEMIKKAFKMKASKVEKMKQQMELLQSSVKEAHKKKSFWTVLSSATTLLAAISLAYVARGH